MKRLLNLKFIILFFILNFFVLSINNVFAEDADILKCQNSCPPGKSCAILPKCKTGCSTGCQPGYYLSDGDGDHTNNCKTVSGGFCTELSLKGICEICPPGFFCPGGMIDKIPCPSGKYIDKMGKTKIGDCANPVAGFCVAKAKLIGPQTATIPSVCLQQSNNVSSNTVRGVSKETETDIPGAINSGFPNDKGINGYTESNTLGANISIPCPVGTYSTSVNGASFCSVPDKGYCTSYDGISCVISDNGGGVIKFGSDLNSAIINAVGAAEKSGLGATKQIPCPVGTYDMRTAYGGNYTKPAPFCVYPDIGHSTASLSTGSYSQTICAKGSYDSRGGSNDSANSSCSLCSPGYYTNTTGQFACSFCSPGTYSNKGNGIYGSTDCEGCSAGTYQANSGMSYCDSCSPGYYTNTTGQFTCSPCSPGTYSNKGADLAGNGIYGSTRCDGCPAGTYQGQEAQFGCISCDENFYSSGSSSSCTPCASGKWSNKGASYCPDCVWSGYSTPTCASDNVYYSSRSIKTGNSNCDISLKITKGACSYCSNRGGYCQCSGRLGLFYGEWAFDNNSGAVCGGQVTDHWVQGFVCNGDPDYGQKTAPAYCASIGKNFCVEGGVSLLCDRVIGDDYGIPFQCCKKCNTDYNCNITQ